MHGPCKWSFLVFPCEIQAIHQHFQTIPIKSVDTLFTLGRFEEVVGCSTVFYLFAVGELTGSDLTVQESRAWYALVLEKLFFSRTAITYAHELSAVRKHHARSPEDQHLVSLRDPLQIASPPGRSCGGCERPSLRARSSRDTCLGPSPNHR